MEEDNSSLYAQEIKNIKQVVERMAAVGKGLSPDFHSIINKIHHPGKIADFILSHINLSVEKSQELLEISDFKVFLNELYLQLIKEYEISDVQERIKSYAKDSLNQSHKGILFT